MPGDESPGDHQGEAPRPSEMSLPPHRVSLASRGRWQKHARHRAENPAVRQPSRNVGPPIRSFPADTPLQPAWRSRWNLLDAIAANESTGALLCDSLLGTQSELPPQGPQCCLEKSEVLAERTSEPVCCR